MSSLYKSSLCIPMDMLRKARDRTFVYFRKPQPAPDFRALFLTQPENAVSSFRVFCPELLYLLNFRIHTSVKFLVK